MALPISAKDLIELRPYTFGVELAKKAAEKLVAEAQKKFDAATVEAEAETAAAAFDKARDRGEKLVANAEEELTKHATGEPVYLIRVPTTRSRAAVTRDVAAEAVPTNSNLAIVEALVAAISDGLLSAEDEAFVREVKKTFDAQGQLADGEWDRAWELAKSVPGAAVLIADRAYRWELERYHLVRHHLVLQGVRSPIPESVADSIPEDHRALIAAKVIDLLTPSEEDAKN